MKSNVPGFSLLEMLLAMSLSALVLLFFMRSSWHLLKLARQTEQVAEYDLRIERSLGQIEHDLYGICAPAIHQESRNGKNNTEKTHQLPLFKAIADDEKIMSTHFKVEGTALRAPLFKRMEFFSTTALAEFGGSSQRLVRIIYELERIKTAHVGEEDRFQLIRTEQTTLIEQKKKDSSRAEEETPINKQIVLTNIRECFVDYLFTDTTVEGSVIASTSFSLNPPDESDGKSTKEKATEENKAVETKKQLPNKIQLRFARLSDDGKTVATYELIIPIISSIDSTDLTTTNSTKQPTTPVVNQSAPLPASATPSPTPQSLQEALTTVLEQPAPENGTALQEPTSRSPAERFGLPRREDFNAMPR